MDIETILRNQSRKGEGGTFVALRPPRFYFESVLGTTVGISVHLDSQERSNECLFPPFQDTSEKSNATE